MSRLRKMSVAILLLAYIPILLLAFLLWSTGYLGAVLEGPKVIQSVASPDGKYVAYVQDDPALDPPNQSLAVERGDKTRFLVVGKLVEDVDSIKEVLWSPDSRIVVFSSHCYLTATRVLDWQTVRIYLGREWVRNRPSRTSTFCGALPVRMVNAVKFPQPDTVAYRIDGEEEWNMIQMNSAGPLPDERSHQLGRRTHRSRPSGEDQATASLASTW